MRSWGRGLHALGASCCSFIELLRVREEAVSACTSKQCVFGSINMCGHVSKCFTCGMPLKACVDTPIFGGGEIAPLVKALDR